MNRFVIAAVISVAVACSPGSEERTDTMSLGAVDTVKAATDTAVSGVSVGATSGAAAASSSTTPVRDTPPTPSRTATKTAPPDTTNLGRDRAIPINTKDPKVRLPTVDTTKRPPNGR
jgi:hypothetical protein